MNLHCFNFYENFFRIASDAQENTALYNESEMIRAENHILHMDGRTMNYILFGKGKKILVLLPGLGDGLRTVKGLALPFALLYGKLAKEYTVYSFSRVNELREGDTVETMADDLADAMELLDLNGADVIGVSMGGMIARQLAVRHPDRVRKLVLCVTAFGANALLKKRVGLWLQFARDNDWISLFCDTAEHTYTEKYLKRNRPFFPLIAYFTKPKDPKRFLIQAEACMNDSAEGQIGKITCPVLMISGEKDDIVGIDDARVLRNILPSAEVHIYEKYGHGLYEETGEWMNDCLQFFGKENPA